MRKFLFLVFVILLGYSLLPAVVSEYNFSGSVDTYTPITDGTVHGTAANDDHSFNAIPIGFDFVFDHTTTNVISVNSNGFIVLGPTAQTSAVSLSNPNANASNRVIAVLNRDLKSKTTGVLQSKLIGTAPDRIFVMQWANYQRYGTANAGDTLNFQVRLHETTNIIDIQYGHIVFGNSSLSSNTFQVGIRGNSNAEFFNRSVIIGTNTWTTSVQGTANTASCAMSPTFVPNEGLTFTFTPPIIGEPPQPAVVTSPVNNAVDILLDAHLIWADGGGGPTGYKVYLGTDNPPTNIVNGQDVGFTTNYTPAAQFAYSTLYYWQIVPYNQFGDADSCLVWTFTTMADPTVNIFPYTQGFESAYYPPLGWTTNGWVRGTEPHTGTYCAKDLYTPAGSRYLMTPKIELGVNQRLRFWWRDADISKVVGHDTTYCEISTNGGTNWTVLATLSATAVESAYHQVVVDLSPYTGNSTYIRWRDNTDGTTSAYGVGLDDITIDVFVPTYNPPTNLTQVSGNASVALAWQAANVIDGMTLSNYKIYRDGALISTVGPTVLTYNNTGLTNGNIYSYYVTSLYTNPAGESVPSNTVEGHPLAPLFDPPSNLTAIQTAWNAVTLSWLLPGDPPPGITEGFEGTFPPTGWTQTITNTGTANTMGVYPTWCQFGTVNLTPAVPPHAGSNQVGLWWSYAHQDEWLITPQFNCPANASLSFWSYIHQGSTNADHYYVKISTTDGASWTTLWDASTLPELDNDYTSPYSISLSAYANQNIKLAWHAIDGPTMDGLWYVWFIDAVTVSAGKNVISFKPGDFTVKSASQPAMNRVASLGAANALRRDGSEPIYAPLPDRSLAGVKVYRNGTLIQTITNPAAHQYVDATVVPNTYIYKVTCYYTNPAGESVYSNEASVTIASYVFNPPTSFNAVAGNAQVVLTWAAPTTGTPTGYKVYRNSTLVTTVGANVLTYTNAGLTNGIPYEYWVTATYTNPTGESAGTNHITVTPTAPVLNPPTNLTGSIIANNTVHLTWQAPSIAAIAGKGAKTELLDRSLLGYRVYKNNTAIQDIMNPTVLTYDAADLDNGSYNFKVTALYTDGESLPSNVISIVSGQDPTVPAVTALNGNYPNPFNPTTVISFSLTNAGYVNLEIFNAQGQKVRTLLDGKVDAGNHQVTWNGNDDKGNPVGSGLYFYKMKSGNFSSTKKMILLK